jgi:hypothetical protein
LYQETEYVHLAAVRCGLQWGSAIIIMAIDICTAIEQKLDDLGVTFVACYV